MNFMSRQLVFREVPDEISLSYLISGCSLRCPGCHSADSWDGSKGRPLTVEHFESELDRYQDAITCVLFLGGEWEEDALCELLDRARRRGLKTCLYTGKEDVSPKLRSKLNFLKVGPYVRSRGGLDQPETNQKFYDLDRNECLNHRFQTNGGTPHDQTHERANSRQA